MQSFNQSVSRNSLYCKNAGDDNEMIMMIKIMNGTFYSSSLGMSYHNLFLLFSFEKGDRNGMKGYLITFVAVIFYLYVEFLLHFFHYTVDNK